MVSVLAVCNRIRSHLDLDELPWIRLAGTEADSERDWALPAPWASRLAALSPHGGRRVARDEMLGEWLRQNGGVTRTPARCRFICDLGEVKR
jgi:hypothetical protein